MSTKDVGNIGETIAASFLERKGYKILARNYRKTFGEIDIIGEKGDSIRFVEVKSVSREKIAPGLSEFSRENTGYRPEELVHEKKLERIAKAAEAYMVETRDERDFQIDVVGVFLDFSSKTARCRLMEGVSL